MSALAALAALRVGRPLRLTPPTLMWEPLPIEVIQDFNARLVMGAADECWLHGLFPRAGNGYAQFKVRGKFWAAHRVSCWLTHGAPAKGQYALHSCDEPACVNPAHLRWGSPADNAADRKASGRATGARINERLSVAQISDIKLLLAAGWHPSAVARAFGIGANSVWRIKRGQRFAEIDGPSPIDGRIGRRPHRFVRRNGVLVRVAHA